MAKVNRVKQENEETTKGTLFSVGIVGAVILVTYLVLYGLYMVRL
ncbi:cytochrome C oxidase subunit II [Bacillus sp. FJAT-49711]|nr:cytochrome C oxidase subunit II [Bacillus sp. FJAT-49711]MBS4220460.1 cytochrome C oxidase subunit II [Bacillus sp. FJAT-49711]